MEGEPARPLIKGRDTRCDKSLRHVAATGCCNKSPRVTCENHCRCDRILSLRSVARIQAGLNSCDISQRQNERKALSQQQFRRGDLSPRRVALCVSAVRDCTETLRFRGIEGSGDRGIGGSGLQPRTAGLLV